MKDLKNIFWPVKKKEYKKFIPMFLIFFLISFNYNTLKIAKDTLVITAPNSGAETIPFIKVWVMLPSAIIITYIYSKISNKFSRENVFYIMIFIFLLFFILFIFFLYPLRDFLCPEGLVKKLEHFLPVGFKGFISLIRNWPFTLFYVMAELWGTIILTVLFWGFANDIMSVNEAKRFYSLFFVGANLASIVSGKTSMIFSKNIFNYKIPFGKTGWDQSVLFLNGLIIISAFFIILIFFFLNKKIPKIQGEQKNFKKDKISIKKNFFYLAKSKYLICIAVIVMSYHVAINLVEIIWKNQVKQLYPNAADYNFYMGQIMILMGILSTIVAIFISGNFLRRFSWTFNALITPFIILITSILFFSFLFLKNFNSITILSFFGFTPLVMSVFFGSIQNCMTKVSKYTLFDATKEISFIPLDKESKFKGKAAIDGIGSRIGKSGGSIIHQGFLIIFSTLSATAPYIAILFLFIVAIWITAVRSLGKQFNELASQKETISVATALD
ncbi:MAG: AAA family ATPase [Chlamydiae bacterium SM23_39]|nr:MAG: AAA family ATPase [Chlamydiae bacterium SM23_39]